LVSNQGIKPTLKKIKAIMDYKKPKTLLELRRFLGIINYYRRSLKNAAMNQAILTEFLKDSRKRDRRIVPWTADSEEAFNKCKEELMQVTNLTHPAPSVPLILTCDASDLAVGASLEQVINGIKKPIAFFSKKLNNSQRSYSTYDRELLAIYLSIKHFRYLIEGRRISIRTDHKPLIYAFRQKLDKASPRQIRQLDFIAQFSTDIEHISGVQNEVADALSRIDTVSLPVIVSLEDLAQAQIDDEELKNLLTTKSSLKLQKFMLSGSIIPIFCDCSTECIRPYIPQQLRRQIFDVVHRLAHPSANSTCKSILQKFIWPSLKKDVKEWCRLCLPCQQSKIQRHTKNSPIEIHVPNQRF
jgi:hypothetical protein